MATMKFNNPYSDDINEYEYMGYKIWRKRSNEPFDLIDPHGKVWYFNKNNPSNFTRMSVVRIKNIILSGQIEQYFVKSL